MGIRGALYYVPLRHPKLYVIILWEPDMYAILCLLLYIYSQTTYNHGYTNLNRCTVFLDGMKHSKRAMQLSLF